MFVLLQHQANTRPCNISLINVVFVHFSILSLGKIRVIIKKINMNKATTGSRLVTDLMKHVQVLTPQLQTRFCSDSGCRV